MLEWAMANAASFYDGSAIRQRLIVCTGRYPCAFTNQNANYT